ncbi:MAG: DNA integrity scanning protein DisA nucleotide-binding domain protein [Gaiellales bacterium]
MSGRADDSLERIFGNVCASADCSMERKRTLEEVIQLAVEIAREGREGRKIGTLFVVGDVEHVLGHSRPLILDPLYGHPSEVLRVDRPEFRETVKELAQLDGAFVVGDDGAFVSAGRYVGVDLADPEVFITGLGTRHAAGASISRETRATAVVVSQSAVVRVFGGGVLRAEIIPELFLLSREQVFTSHPEISQLPEAGLTMAVASDGSA